MQIKEEIPMKCTHLISCILTSWPKRNWSCFEINSAYFMFTFMSSGHSKNKQKTLLESVAASFSKGGNGINSNIIGMESLWEDLVLEYLKALDWRPNAVPKVTE